MDDKNKNALKMLLKEAIREVLKEEGTKRILREVISTNQMPISVKSNNTDVPSSAQPRQFRDFVKKEATEPSRALTDAKSQLAKLGLPAFIFENVKPIATSDYTPEGEEIPGSLDTGEGIDLGVIEMLTNKRFQ